ncbi:hypothetical protein E1A91_D03G169700v1 [Gossypium mustelinum]|uniref:BLOC-1-related complex subunit 6 C-terminal helix domain-containing protein n=3 Tax=Gossypium TaxID=3633 RepID=A0A5J5S605_GOSBA|nr:hypothetical protein ES319_D03G175400v1 [Gossypium barbadense]PPD97693.1 hypothetical protein GOBAR_DD05296 [Gossypium barbadense]TYH81238.1 hypothetical protein ES332_D03G185600v1 [Gossypium tomentosum]TYI91126.1 hypothetical protein E1A91_D03G169700v1 [Gossypium mustelinum]
MEESSSATTGDQRDKSTEEEVIIREVDTDQPSTCPENELDDRELDGSESKPPLNKSDILKAVEVVERDSRAIADSFSSLFASLRLALSEVTSGSVDHMRCFGDAAGRLQESALDAATKGNRYINSCLRKVLRRNVDALDTAVNKLVRLP